VELEVNIMSTRYFKTSNALRPYIVDGAKVQFEQLRLIGGLFSGVLKVDSDEFADKIKDLGKPISEITVAVYDDLKKKVPASSPSFSNTGNQPQVPLRKPAPAATAKKLPEPEAEIGEDAEPDDLLSTGDLDTPIDHLEATPPVERVSKKDK
jgi:hypothetical protein